MQQAPIIIASYGGLDVHNLTLVQREAVFVLQSHNT